MSVAGRTETSGADRDGTAYVSAGLDPRDTTIVAALDTWAARTPDRAALEFEGRRISFSHLEALSRRVAGGLRAMGVGRGARIVYYAKNSDDFYVLLLGAARAGVVLAPINWRLPAREAAQIAEDCGSAAHFVSADLREAFTRALPGRLAERPVVTLGTLEGCGFHDWIAAQPAMAEDPGAHPDDVLLQLYTSGTTGRPKGAMLSHASVLVPQRLRLDADVSWDRWTPDDATLVAMPLGHIGGCRLGLLALCNGARAVVTPEFKPERLLDLIEQAGVTRLFIVPTALRLLLDDPRTAGADFSRLKTLFYGASPMPLPLLRESLRVIGCGFVQLYGMTETCGAIVALGPEDHDPEGGPEMRSTGRALPGVEVAIVGVDGLRAPTGTPGEIVTRSASNMVGYWNDPDATRATIDADGWLRTGDVGSLDGRGYLTIHDRVKDVVISGGENIYPAEVEAVFVEHPSIAEAAVIGVPDAKWGEAVKAILVPRPGAQPDADELIDWARGRIGFKAPKTIDFAADLPRNASGKVLKRSLREPHWKGQSRQVN